MKSLKYIALITVGSIAFSCEQELKTFTNDPCEGSDPGIICHPDPVPDCPDGASKGSADFTKFVAIGSSFTAGFQAGALFTDGQNASVPAILASKFACVGGPASFNQPTIGTAGGFNIFVSPNPVGGTTVLGRFRLQGTPPAPSPIISDAAAIPNPVVNPGFVYTGSKTELNNFAVQAVFLGQALIPETGNWTLAGVDPRFNPFYARFASNPGTSTMLTDMITSLTDGGTFFMFWLGMDDFLLNAVYGGDNSLAPLTPIEFESAQNPGFKYLFNTAMGGILMNPSVKGVVANFPNIFTMPHFTSVKYNPIPMDAATATLVNSNYAGYNQILDALKGPPFNYSASEMDARKISFAASAGNPFVIIDETLNDLGDEFDALLGADMITPEQRAALAPYEQVRMTTATDIIPLSTGSVLGKLADPNNPLSIQGVAVPLGDRYAIIPSESAEILNRITEFNAHIKSFADGNERVAHADIHKAFADFAASGFYVRDGVTITYNINPPTGIYSEDGLHPNSRGYAFVAGAIVDGINAKFGGTIPKPNLGKYGATGLPINP